MEVFLFHRQGKKAKSSFAKPLKDLTAIISPAEMLADKKRKGLLDQLSKYSALDLTRFETLCLALIHNLIHQCQRLPETANSYYAMAGGLVDHALNRTEAALNLFRDYIIKDENQEISEEQKLWIYTLFSAAILQGIGKLQTDYRVDLFDVNGQLLKSWTPLLETMAAVGNHYCFEFLEESEANFRQRLNILMARLLMPANGYAWIISNPEALAVWLALLNEDTHGAGTLGAILIRADAIAIQRYFNQLRTTGSFGRSGRGGGRVSTFVDNIPEPLSEKEAQIGIEFIKWLTQELEGKKLTVNNLHLFIVSGGVLISEDLFKMYVEKFPQYKTWQVIQKGLLSLGIHKLGLDGTPLSRFEQTDTNKMLSGIVLDNYVALPEQMQVKNVTTGEISTISALEVIHMAQYNQPYIHQSAHVLNPAGTLNHLSSSGKWEAPVEAPDAALRNKRGV